MKTTCEDRTDPVDCHRCWQRIRGALQARRIANRQEREVFDADIAEISLIKAAADASILLM